MGVVVEGKTEGGGEGEGEEEEEVRGLEPPLSRPPHPTPIPLSPLHRRSPPPPTPIRTRHPLTRPKTTKEKERKRAPFFLLLFFVPTTTEASAVSHQNRRPFSPLVFGVAAVVYLLALCLRPASKADAVVTLFHRPLPSSPPLSVRLSLSPAVSPAPTCFMDSSGTRRRSVEGEAEREEES